MRFALIPLLFTVYWDHLQLALGSEIGCGMRHKYVCLRGQSWRMGGRLGLWTPSCFSSSTIIIFWSIMMSTQAAKSIDRVTWSTNHPIKPGCCNFMFSFLFNATSRLCHGDYRALREFAIIVHFRATNFSHAPRCPCVEISELTETETKKLVWVCVFFSLSWRCHKMNGGTLYAHTFMFRQKASLALCHTNSRNNNIHTSLYLWQ